VRSSAAFHQAIIKYYEVHHRYDLLQLSKKQFPQLNPAEEGKGHPPLRYLLLHAIFGMFKHHQLYDGARLFHRPAQTSAQAA